jgi:fatty-acyl-CoA synthase
MPEGAQQIASALDVDFLDIFGQTETSYLLAVGRIAPGEVPSLRKTPMPLLDVRLVDDDLKEVPVGVPGECVVRGPSVMSGYLDEPDATADAFRGGWLHTGDVLVRHDDGTLTYTDRRKYLIKTGGENVYPAEVEQVIAAHVAVAEVCVFAIPDERWGETIKAAVVIRPDHTLSSPELAAWCRSRLAGYKAPTMSSSSRAKTCPETPLARSSGTSWRHGRPHPTSRSSQTGFGNDLGRDAGGRLRRSVRCRSVRAIACLAAGTRCRRA